MAGSKHHWFYGCAQISGVDTLEQLFSFSNEIQH